MIDGLKLTMTGEELRTRLEERVRQHERAVEHYKHEATREPDRDDESDYVLPEHMCEYEQEFHQWRAERLAYIREHIEGGEVYRLGPDDLEFGEILPPKPGLIEQDEFERENRIGFSMERIAKEIDGSGGGAYAIAEALAAARREQQERQEPARRRRSKSRAAASKA